MTETELRREKLDRWNRFWDSLTAFTLGAGFGAIVVGFLSLFWR